MKDAVIKILNRKINEILVEKEIAKQNQNLFQIGIYKKTIDVLIEVIKEIQDNL